MSPDAESATMSSESTEQPQPANAAAVVDLPAPAEPTNATALPSITTALAWRHVTPRNRSMSPRTGPKKYEAAFSIDVDSGQSAQAFRPSRLTQNSIPSKYLRCSRDPPFAF